MTHRDINNKKLLSVILPIYKVEPYIEKCMRSLLNQDLRLEDYEIICVNDGSPDKSRDVVLRLQKEADNIVLIDQENGGVSQARNRGLVHATGKYILFVDPDDYLEENRLADLLNEIESKNARLAVPGYIYLDPDGREEGRKIFDKYEGKVFSGIEAFHLMRMKKQIIIDSSVGILFEAGFLKENPLRYTPGVILNQDAELMARIHCLADRLIFVSCTLYIVQTRPGSATHSNQTGSEKVRKGFELATSNLKQFQQNESLSENQQLFLNGPITQFALLAMYSAMKARSFQALRKTFRSLKESGLRKLRLKGTSAYQKLCGGFYNLSPFLGALVLVFYLKIEHVYGSLLRKGNG